MLSSVWATSPAAPSRSADTPELTVQGAGTRLVLTHTRVADPAGPDFAAGWHRYLDALSAVAAGVEPSPARGFLGSALPAVPACRRGGVSDPGPRPGDPARRLVAAVVGVTAFGPLSMDMYLPAWPRRDPYGTPAGNGGLVHGKCAGPG
jgi:hypothetical protein